MVHFLTLSRECSIKGGMAQLVPGAMRTALTFGMEYTNRCVYHWHPNVFQVHPQVCVPLTSKCVSSSSTTITSPLNSYGIPNSSQWCKAARTEYHTRQKKKKMTQLLIMLLILFVPPEIHVILPYMIKHAVSGTFTKLSRILHLMHTLNFLRALANASTVSRSRWLVGSSRIR